MALPGLAARLLDQSVFVVLRTTNRDGSPQSTPPGSGGLAA